MVFSGKGKLDDEFSVTTAFSQATASKRSVPRYELTVPLALTVLRSGIPNACPRTLLRNTVRAEWELSPASQLTVRGRVRPGRVSCSAHELGGAGDGGGALSA